MTSLGLTSGQGLYFLNAAQNQALLAMAGFQADIVRLDSWSPYPHVLFVARPVGPRRRHMTTRPIATQQSASNTQPSVELSVVIPAYNEEAVIGDTVARVAAYLEATGYHELIVVDDGSRDAHREHRPGLCRAARLRPPGEQSGQPRQGLRHPQWRAPLSRRIRPLHRRRPRLSDRGRRPVPRRARAGADVAIGSRSHAGHALRPPPPPFLLHLPALPRRPGLHRRRELAPPPGRHRYAVRLQGLPRRRVARDVFARLCLDDFAFDVEALYVAQAAWLPARRATRLLPLSRGAEQRRASAGLAFAWCATCGASARTDARACIPAPIYPPKPSKRCPISRPSGNPRAVRRRLNRPPQ